MSAEPAGRMSLERRLVLSVSLALLATLLVGAILTYVHALTKVRTEMAAALEIGVRLVENAVDDVEEPRDAARRLADLVADFNGDRHLRVRLIAPDGRIVASSSLAPPDDPAPHAFFALVAGPTMEVDVPLPPALDLPGQLHLQTDAHSEVAEAWSDLQLTLAILATFFGLGLALLVLIVRHALVPLRDLRDGLARIAAGHYDTRVRSMTYRELEPVQRGFNDMASRLAGAEARNAVLQAQLQQIQEEERAELARDLHDEVAPFLFAVAADAVLIRQFVSAGAVADAAARAEAIGEAVRHMQKHVRSVLAQIMPNTLVDLGLAGAIEALIGFWRTRRPDIAFRARISEEPIEDRLRSVAFRIVQESLSNAVRHAEPSTIEVRIEAAGTDLVIEVSDDGRGLAPDDGAPTLGVAGMRERAKSVGGLLVVGRRDGGAGVSVRATLPRAANVGPPGAGPGGGITP